MSRCLGSLISALLIAAPAAAAPPAEAGGASHRADDTDARTLAGLTGVLNSKGRALEQTAAKASRARFSFGERAHGILALLADLRGRRAMLTRRGPGEAPSALFERQRAFLGAQIAWLERIQRTTYFDPDVYRKRRRAQPPEVTPEEVRRALPPASVLLEFTLHTAPGAPTGYGVYVLPHRGAPRFVDLGPQAPIDEAAEALRAAARSPGDAGVRAKSATLSRALLQPLWPHAAGFDRWIIAPDGPLHLLPFELLATPDGRWLDAAVAISYLHAGRALTGIGATTEPGGPPLIVADPTFEPPGSKDQPPARIDLAGMRFPPLPATAREADAIAAYLPGARIVLGRHATEYVVKAARGPVVLHLATHGFLLGAAAAAAPQTRGITLAGAAPPAAPVDPETAALLDAGLALAGVNRSDPGGQDGVLTALEVSALDLRGTALAVLSACETGLGRSEIGEGIAGFRRALAVAGAESQVLSAWKVDDAATSALMSGFYRRLAAGEGRADALRGARAELRSDPARAHPFYWAAFTLAGDWRPLTLP